MPKPFSFTVNATDGNARTGVITTAHGDIQTPAFMPVGTQGTVKALTNDMVKSAGAECILGNTYHLMLRPTAERINELGGLHKFMQWDRPILTDSGGFQVMSLSKLAKVTKEGVTFQSHLDGSKHELTPERSMQIQQLLGSDIVMAFDECTHYPISEHEAAESMLLSIEWAKRCKEAYRPRDGHALFGIVQGSVYRRLREDSAKMTADLDFDGYAVGGLAVGEGQNLMFNVLDYTTPLMPEDKPRYLMGVGKPEDIVGAVMRGVDMFDCVIPTRSGRNGQAFTKDGPINIRNSKYATDPEPLDAESDCPASRDYSKAYLHHLVKSDEILGSTLMSWHNVDYYQKLMTQIRTAISEGNLQKLATKYL